MTKILVVDDEPSIRNLVALSLKEEGYSILEASSVAEGVRSVIESHPNLIILDLGLPDGSGLDFVMKVRQWSKVPIIMLTVVDDEQTKIRLLEAGADDYITKPFGVGELAARVRVAFRHAQTERATPLFRSGDLEVNLANREIRVGGVLVHLTATEYEILRLLVKNGGQIVSQEQLLSDVWGRLGTENPHYIRIYIGHLRKKLESDPSLPKHIITEPGVGYRIR